MILPSAADIVAAFVRDLGNVIALSQGATPPQRVIYLAVGTGVSNSWLLDADYEFTAAIIDGQSASWAIELDSTNTSAIQGSAPKTYLDQVLATGTSTPRFINGLKIPMKRGQRIYCFNGSAGSQWYTLYLNRV